MSLFIIYYTEKKHAFELPLRFRQQCFHWLSQRSLSDEPERYADRPYTAFDTVL